MRILAAAALAALAQDSTAQTEGKVPWVKDYAKALATSKETGKPIFLFFGCC